MTLTWRSLWKALLSCWKLWYFEICLLWWKQNISQKPTWFLPECAPLGCLRVMRVQIRWFHVVFVSMLIGVALTVEAETRFFWCFLSLLLVQLSVTYHQFKGLSYPNYPRPSKSRLLEDLTPAIHSNPEVEMILQQRKAPVPKNPREKKGGNLFSNLIRRISAQKREVRRCICDLWPKFTLFCCGTATWLAWLLRFFSSFQIKDQQTEVVRANYWEQHFISPVRWKVWFVFFHSEHINEYASNKKHRTSHSSISHSSANILCESTRLFHRWWFLILFVSIWINVSIWPLYIVYIEYI